jgi:hypothetical protein
MADVATELGELLRNVFYKHYAPLALQNLGSRVGRGNFTPSPSQNRIGHSRVIRLFSGLQQPSCGV